jgi:Tfp pilus assembly protein PilX
MTRALRGAALPVTLVLLSGLGALALAAAAAAAAALALASHQQLSQAAFEAAEAAIVQALVRTAATRSTGSIPPSPYPNEADASARFEAEILEAAEPGALPVGFSVGENPDTFAARHFFIVADGRSGRASRVRLEQGFYLVVPAP